MSKFLLVVGYQYVISARCKTDCRRQNIQTNKQNAYVYINNINSNHFPISLTAVDEDEACSTHKKQPQYALHISI